MIKVIKTARAWIYVSFLICNSNFVLADITSDTEKLLNWAESKYPEFFPGHSATQTNIEPWLYRFYPGTGVYAGVNKSANGDAVAVWLENDPGVGIDSVWGIALQCSYRCLGYADVA